MAPISGLLRTRLNQAKRSVQMEDVANDSDNLLRNRGARIGADSETVVTAGGKPSPSIDTVTTTVVSDGGRCETNNSSSILVIGQIVDASAPERWGLFPEELLGCLFDVVVGLGVLTIQMTLEIGKKVVIRGSQIWGIRTLAWARICLIQPEKITQEQAANTATKPWADEIAKYGLSAMNEYRSDIGHATKVLWAETLTVGCGITHCSNGWIMVVCQYYPPGNHIGSSMYKEGTTLSECGPERRQEIPLLKLGYVNCCKRKKTKQ
ncbi:hypothetical protein RB195_002158 [Necator americanus]|uniref:SCP domain-containing protein n=1 Tax=Necator americanus TaxID=51031 RepID=A0ABR1DJ28_NECAM